MAGKVYRSAMGKQVDMSILRAKNEKERAVGNMNVNARGDVIDSNNQIINDNNNRINVMYQKTMNSDAVARAKAKQEQSQRQKLTQEQQIAQEQNTKSKSRAKKTPEPDLSEDEANQFNEFNEPNPKK
jgi:regulator of RNase E activity RraA